MRNLGLKLTTAIGACLFILGLCLFLQSLGSGGGFLAVALMLIGAVSIVIVIVMVIAKHLKPIDRV